MKLFIFTLCAGLSLVFAQIADSGELNTDDCFNGVGSTHGLGERLIAERKNIIRTHDSWIKGEFLSEEDCMFLCLNSNTRCAGYNYRKDIRGRRIPEEFSICQLLNENCFADIDDPRLSVNEKWISDKWIHRQNLCLKSSVNDLSYVTDQTTDDGDYADLSYVTDQTTDDGDYADFSYVTEQITDDGESKSDVTDESVLVEDVRFRPDLSFISGQTDDDGKEEPGKKMNDLSLVSDKISNIDDHIQEAPACTRLGNTYILIPNTNCQSFSQSTSSLEPSFQKCSGELMFDIVTCVCNWPRVDMCPL